MYSEQVLDHFQNPRHAGEVEQPDAVAEVSNPVCGDVLRLSARVVDGQVADVRFRARGCVPAMACGSRVAEMIQGKPVAQAATLQRDDLVESLGGLPAASSHAAQLAIDAVRKLVQQLK